MAPPPQRLDPGLNFRHPGVAGGCGKMSGRIRTGIGGWTFPPWRGVFYPDGLRQADELAYARRRSSAPSRSTAPITHCRSRLELGCRGRPQRRRISCLPIKGSRFCTNRKVLGDAGEAIARFMGQGLTELGPKLGPDPVAVHGRPRNSTRTTLQPSSPCLPERARRPAAEALRGGASTQPSLPRRSSTSPGRHGVAICASENPDYPLIADVSSPTFVYGRLDEGA